MKKLMFLLTLLMFILPLSALGGICQKHSLTDDEISYVREMASNVDEETAARFAELHENWYADASKDYKILLDSSMDARKKLPQFKELVEMGESVLPLVAEKLMDEKYFFSQIIFMAIIDLQYPDKYSDKYRNLSGQERAIALAKDWVRQTSGNSN